jgi:PPM family protein phosphatase
MRLSWAAATDPGLRRPANEDSYCARPDLGLFVVADGMGGHAAGEVASRLAVETIEAVVADATPRPPSPPPNDGDTDPTLEQGVALMREAFLAANDQIARAVRQEAGLRGMATTASALLVEEGALPVVAHVGDSRIYVLRGGTLRRVTQDHSWVEEQVRAGVLDAAAARQHPWRSVVTRALNGAADTLVDAFPFALVAGDRALLCSDGLSSVVADERIAEVLREGDPEHTCRELIALANTQGGPDNITVVVLHIHAA